MATVTNINGHAVPGFTNELVVQVFTAITARDDSDAASTTAGAALYKAGWRDQATRSPQLKDRDTKVKIGRKNITRIDAYMSFATVAMGGSAKFSDDDISFWRNSYPKTKDERREDSDEDRKRYTAINNKLSGYTQLLRERLTKDGSKVEKAKPGKPTGAKTPTADTAPSKGSAIQFSQDVDDHEKIVTMCSAILEIGNDMTDRNPLETELLEQVAAFLSSAVISEEK